MKQGRQVVAAAAVGNVDDVGDEDLAAPKQDTKTRLQLPE